MIVSKMMFDKYLLIVPLFVEDIHFKIDHLTKRRRLSRFLEDTPS